MNSYSDPTKDNQDLGNPYELPEWSHPPDYGGFSPDGDFILLSTNRDADLLTQSNWETITEHLLKLEPVEKVLHIKDSEERHSRYFYTFTANHWACGWVEYLLLRRDAPDCHQKAAYEVLGALADYPVFDDEHFSLKEVREAERSWESYPVKERVEVCRELGISIFAARRDEMPEDPNGSLQEYLLY